MPSTAARELVQGRTIRRVTPTPAYSARSSGVATSPGTVISIGSARPADSASSARRLTEPGRSASPWFMGIPPAPTVTARRGAVAPDVQGQRPLDRLGLERGGPEVEERAVVLDDRIGPQPPAYVNGLVDARAARVEVESHRLPFAAQPARADAEVEPPSGEDVHGRGRARGEERMAQADVVDVRSEPDLRRPRRQVSQDAERVVDRHVGRDRRVVGSAMRAAGRVERDDDVLGHPHRLEAEPVRLLRDLAPEARVDRAEMDPELHAVRPLVDPGPPSSAAALRTLSMTSPIAHLITSVARSGLMPQPAIRRSRETGLHSTSSTPATASRRSGDQRGAAASTASRSACPRFWSMAVNVGSSTCCAHADAANPDIAAKTRPATSATSSRVTPS